MLDHDTWIFNLTEANTVADQETMPRWFKEYSFREYYAVSSCSPAALQALVTNDFIHSEPLSRKVSLQLQSSEFKAGLRVHYI